MDETDRNVWAGLVDFANAELPDDKALRIFAETVRNAMPPTAWQQAHNEEGEWQGEDDWQGRIYQFLNQDVISESVNGDREPAFDIFATDARSLQPKIRVLLRYLCEAPKFDVRNPLVREACDFLWTHETHVSFMKVAPQQMESATESRTSFERMTSRVRLYPYMNVRRYKCMVDPICELINDQLEQYYAGKTAYMVPIIICKRPGCGKFVIPQRIGRKMFCNDCKDKHHNTKRAEQGADERWLYRRLGEGKNDPALLRTKLKKAETKERLATLKKPFPELVARIQAFAK